MYTLDLARAQVRELERVAEIARRSHHSAPRRARRLFRAA